MTKTFYMTENKKKNNFELIYSYNTSHDEARTMLRYRSGVDM